MNDLLPSQNLESIDAPDDLLISSGAFLPDKFAVSPTGEKFVVFFLNGQPFGVAARTIAEVSRPLTVAPVPNAPEWLSGVANLRGEVVSIINLPKILRKDDLTASAKSKFIVLHNTDSDALIAFMIEKPGEIIFMTTDEIQKTADEAAPYIFGKVPYSENILQLLDVEKILGSLVFH